MSNFTPLAFEFDPNVSIWDQLTDLHFAYTKAGIAYTRAMRQFLKEDTDRVAFLRQGLRKNTHVRAMAFQIVRNLRTEESLQLLPEILYAYCDTSDGDIQTVRDVVLSFPRGAVLDKIEEAAEPILVNGTEREYRLLLELYVQLDPTLTNRLAKRASESSDAEIKEAGEDYLKPDVS